MNLTALSLELDNIRQQKKEVNATLKTLTDREDVLLRDIHRQMEDIGADNLTISGLKFARVEETTATPDPDFWQDIFNWIASTENWQLIRKQLNVTSVRELADIGQQIPHVTIGKTEKLKVTNIA